LKVRGVPATLAKIDTDWSDHASREDAVRLISGLFPGTRESNVDYSGYYRRFNSLVCLKAYDAGAFEMDAYSSTMDGLTKGISSAFRGLSASAIPYSIDDIDIKLEANSRRSRALGALFQGGLLLALATFGLGTLLSSSLLPPGWLIPGIVAALIAIPCVYVPLYVFVLGRGQGVTSE
jgi:hypothetical protein